MQAVAKISKPHRMRCFWNGICYAAFFFLTIPSHTKGHDSIRYQPKIPAFQLRQPITAIRLTAVPPAQIRRVVAMPSVPAQWGWGVFCVGEYKLQQVTRVPLHFRLGSLEYVNRLEGKLR
jgi:hypothetical protein